MSKKSEDSLENFFRKAANQYDTQYRESDWQQMEKLLDANSAVTATVRKVSRRRMVYYAVGGMILISGALLIGLNWTSNEQEISASPQARNQHISSPERAVVSAGEQKVAAVDDIRKEPQTARKHSVQKAVQPVSDQGLKSVDTRHSTRQPAEDEISRDASLLNPAPDPAAEAMTVRPDARSTNNLDESSPLSDPREVIHVTQLKSGTSPANAATVIPEDPVIADTPLSENTDETDKTPGDDGKLKTESKKLPRSRLSVALMLAPDFSSTALSRYSSPGRAYGVMFGFSLLNRWSVNSGVVRSSKQYEGYGSEYQPPTGYWERRTNGIVPEHIEGACEIVEVPIIVQYNIRQNDRSRIFVSVGVSSYFMLRESYQYSFETPNPGAAPGWSSQGPSRYLFGVGHLSAGYERQVHSRLAIGIEPFLKVPFSGIGWSDINLFTTGAYVSLRYTILKRDPAVRIEGRNKTTQR